MSTLTKFLIGAAAALAVAILAYIDPALAQEAAAEVAPEAAPAAPTLDTGDTAWMLTSTAIVLLMTIPGLALFYGGMVRKKNVLSVVMQCFAIACLITLIWFVAGYSLAFTDGGSLNSYIGGMSKALLKGVGKDSLTLTIPESVFFTFQLTFAIITPALIVGAFVDRMKFSALVMFMVLWSLFVYAPIGAGLFLLDEAPGFLEAAIERGRNSLDTRITTARSTGEVALAFGVPMLRSKVEGRVARLLGRAPTTATTVEEPPAAPEPPAPAVEPAEPAPTTESVQDAVPETPVRLVANVEQGLRTFPLEKPVATERASPPERLRLVR